MGGFYYLCAMSGDRPEITICSCGSRERSEELVEALRIARPGTVFNHVISTTGTTDVKYDWFMMLDPDSVSVFEMMRCMKNGILVITVESETSDRMLDDDCAVIFGPDPQNEEFVRGMLPFIESDVRKQQLNRSAAEKFQGDACESNERKEPLVSILLLTYNQGETAGRAIESILGQQCDFPYEIIIGDDCSTDGTSALCRYYAEEYPGIVRLMPDRGHRGLVNNYFDCFNSARGVFIGDCAGDDYWDDPFRLEKQCRFLSEHSDCVAVMSDWTISENGFMVKSTEIEECPEFRKGFTGQEMINFIIGFRRYFPFLSAMLFRKDCLTDIYRMNPTYLCREEWGCEDVPVLFTLATKGNIGYLPLSAAVYNIRNGSVSNNKDNDGGYEFIKGLTGCIRDLCELHKVDCFGTKEAKGMNARLLYLASLILERPDSEKISDFEQLCAKWPVPLSLKLSLYRLSFKSRLGIKSLRGVKKLLILLFK